MTKQLIRSYDGTELFVLKNFIDNPKAVIVLIHGLGEHCGRYDYVTEKLNSFGYSILRYDHKGHGRSGGARGYLADYNQFVDDAHMMVKVAREQYPDLPLFMLGHSMGGFITAAYGVKYPGMLTGQILSGPCITVLPIFEELQDVDLEADPLSLIDNGLSDVICRDREVVETYQQDHLVLMDFTKKLMIEVFIKGAQWLTANISHYHYPCLIMHGGDDRIVPSSNSEFLHENSSSKDSTVKIWPELFHEILNERVEKELVLEEIRNWIEARIA